ncbi:MAG: branched-chain amino acid ABC transporter substrate-binding protein [Synergistaceae bacterium]|nr:branched-chain amino acid ABC transporter substrate-binding protein [Synergistaceae bacterium]
MSGKTKLLRMFFLSLFVIGLLIGGSSADAAESVVKVGFLGPITGSDAAEGAAARNAFTLAISEANKSGEFPFKIEVIEVDDQGTENVAVAGAQEIVSDSDIVAASGFWNSGPAAAAIPVFKEAEIPLLIWGAIRESLTNKENVPYITRSAPTDKQENIPLAIKVLDEMGYRDWFIVSDVSSYGDGNLNAFKAELAARKITPIGEEQVPEDTTDLNAVVQKVKASGAKAVYCGSTVAIGSQLKRQLNDGGVRDILYCGISGMKTEDFLKIGAEPAEGTLVVSPGIILEDTTEGSNFINLYNSQGYSEPIGAFTPYAYEAALILIKSMRACEGKPTAEAMTRAILDSKTTGIMGTTTFNEIGQTENVAAYLNVVQDGKWVPLDKSEYSQGGKRAFGGK